MPETGDTSQHGLESGTPCVKHRCVLCCVETEMPLSILDIRRIEQLGYQLKDFAQKKDEEWRLRNKSGKCFFLADNGCKIYHHRPEGCQIYPLVWDEDQQKAIIDYLCPHSDEFKIEKSDIRKLKTFLRSLE